LIQFSREDTYDHTMVPLETKRKEFRFLSLN